MDRGRGVSSRDGGWGEGSLASCSRRRFLGAIGAGATVPAAGCLGAGRSPSPAVDGPDVGTAPTPDSSPGASVSETYRDVRLPVPESELVRAAGKDDIPAITEPAFGPDWSTVPPDLVDENLVIGVEIDGVTRAYPLKLLALHEVVNDVFEPRPEARLTTADGEPGRPTLVTYCPLCASGVVADRTVDGAAATFGVSGLLWRSDLVMYDEATGSLWSQLLARAIRGELAGTNLPLYPSTLTTWGQWRGAHPGAEVLLPPPASNTVRGRVQMSYDGTAYSGYDSSRRIGVGEHGPVDDRMHPKTMVLGVANDGVARAYPLPTLARAGVVNDTVGGKPVVVAAVGTTLVAYDRRVERRVLTFDRDDDLLLGGGSRWDPLSGRAIDGPYEGLTLARANARSPMFWFAWADFYPGTEVYDG